MTKSKYKRIDEIFTAALELEYKDRATFVAKHSADDSAVRDEVMSLLEASEQLSDIDEADLHTARDRLVAQVFGSNPGEGEDLTGQFVGHWLVGEKIARGGLATVYRASRSDGEFEQNAAFKVLRRGLDTDDLISRFRAERQILSTLEHPSIASILDGGALRSGRPYLVLEYVDGLNITLYCKQNAVDVAHKVRLIIRVLRALHHAHQRLIVHRDVKPSNILITPDNTVSLLDFGIAKILDPSTVSGASSVTRTGMSLLTPGYGSPEQHAGGVVTTASDIYQCGLVLYELLSGERPQSVGDIRQSGPDWVPSQALQGTVEFKQVKGDLDAIVAKATHADPQRRYGSADDMAADLIRYLDGRPVLAQRDSLGYRLYKFSKRWPWALPAGVIALLGIFAYMVTITVYSQRLAEEEKLAAASQEFLINLFQSPDPFTPADQALGRDITVLQALDIGRERIDSELADQPRLRASLLGSVADVFASLDRQDDAVQMLEEALSLQEQLYGAESPQVAKSLRHLTPLYRAAGNTIAAEETAARQLSLARSVYHANSAEVGLALIASGIDANDAGEQKIGRELLAEGIDVLRPYRRQYADETIAALIVYIQNLSFNSLDGELAAIEEADEIAREIYGVGSLQRARVQVRFASSLTMLRDYSESERNFLEALPVLEARLGKDHSSNVAALSNLAFMYLQKGDHDKAQDIFLELLDRQRRVFGDGSRYVADSSQNLGALYARIGEHEKALQHLRQAHKNYKSLLNEDNYVIAYPLLTMAYSHLQLGNSREAGSAAREALRLVESSLPGTYVEGVAQCLVGVALERQGQVEAGTRLIELSHQQLDKGAVPDTYRSMCRYDPPDASRNEP